MTADDRPPVTDNTRAALHPVVTEHQIIGTQTGKQGAGQVVPEDSVLCIKCGWMRCSDYTWHLSDALAAGRTETTTEATERIARQIARETAMTGRDALELVEVVQALQNAETTTATTEDAEAVVAAEFDNAPDEGWDSLTFAQHIVKALADAGLLKTDKQ